MGWLHIDTRVNGHSLISWIEGKDIETIQVEGKAARALSVMARLVQDRSSSIQGILVASGPGTFSSIRTGVLYANLCSRLLHVPLVELGEDESGVSHASSIITEVEAGTRLTSDYVAPIYDREPNITIPKPV